MASTCSGLLASSLKTTNSSPPILATLSWPRVPSDSRAATAWSSRSPASWPRWSLTCLKPSRFQEQDGNPAPGATGAIERHAEPVGEQFAIRQAGEGIVQHSVPQLLLMLVASGGVLQDHDGMFGPAVLIAHNVGGHPAPERGAVLSAETPLSSVVVDLTGDQPLVLLGQPGRVLLARGEGRARHPREAALAEAEHLLSRDVRAHDPASGIHNQQPRGEMREDRSEAFLRLVRLASSGLQLPGEGADPQHHEDDDDDRTDVDGHRSDVPAPGDTEGRRDEQHQGQEPHLPPAHPFVHRSEVGESGHRGSKAATPRAT